MKAKRGNPFGGKRIADKIRKVFKHMPQETREAIGLEMIAELRRVTEGVGEVDSDMEERDRRDLKASVMGVSATQIVLSFLEGAPGMAPMFEAIEVSEKDYMPGGPPMSPVHDSLWIAWSCLDLRIGRHAESAADIVCGLMPMFGMDRNVVAVVELAMQSRLGVYKIVASLEPQVGAGARLRLCELVTRREIVVQFFEKYEPFSEMNLLLLRELPASESQHRERGVTHVTIGTPYVIVGANTAEWHDYFERESAKVSKSRLTPATYEAIMRGAGDPTRWLEYVMVGYLGEDSFSVVRVRGIPDRPETLPHHRDYDARLEEQIPPGATPKERSQILSNRMSSRYRQLMKHADPRVTRRLARIEPAIVESGGKFDLWAPFLMPLVLYRYAPGGPPLTTFADRVVEVDDDLAEWIAVGRQARVSAYEVIDVVAGQRMTLRDVFDGEEIVVEERSATMQMPTRTLLLGMAIPYRGIWILEGLYGRPMLPAARVSLVEELSPMRALDAEGMDLERLEDIIATWQRAETAALAQRMRDLPRQIATTTGEAVRPTHAVFALGANRRADVLHAISRLRRCESVDTSGSDGEHRVDDFVILTRSGMLEAELSVGEQTLEIKTLAPERARKVLSRIRSKLDAPIEPLSREIEDLSSPELFRKVAPRERVPPSEHQVAVVREFFVRRYASFVDEPIPALDGKTPRQAARVGALRQRLDDLLREHEHGVTQQVGVGVVDFTAIRRELGLGK